MMKASRIRHKKPIAGSPYTPYRETGMSGFGHYLWWVFCMDTNEKIIEEWLRLCRNQFTITNIPFKVFGPKGGSNYSNIDILSVDTKGNFYDYEVKFRSEYLISATDVKEYIEQLNRKERAEKIFQIIGKIKYKKIFIATKIMFGKKQEKINDFLLIFKKENIEVLFFEDVIADLIKAVNLKGRYDSQMLQIIRLLKKYSFINTNLN